MTRTTFWYVVRMFLGYCVSIFGVVLVIFIIADLGDRVRMVSKGEWMDVLELYGNKALVASLQLGPAALLLGASATVSTLRKRGELSALRSLTFGTQVLYVPIAVCSLVCAVGLWAFDEWVVTGAGERVDHLTVTRFNTWGDWRFFYSPKQWFRRGDRIFHLRHGDVERGFENVTILTLNPEFELLSRLDAEKMEFVSDTTWKLTNVVERRFRNQAHSLHPSPLSIRELGLRREDLQIRQGRPEQMTVPRLLEQIAIRSRVGLSIRRFQLALHNRFAYPLTGVAAALLAVGLAMRPGRKGHLTVALMEGFAIAMALWVMMVVAKSLVLAERVVAWAAAWSPLLILLSVAVYLGARQEGWNGKWPLLRPQKAP